MITPGAGAGPVIREPVAARTVHRAVRTSGAGVSKVARPAVFTGNTPPTVRAGAKPGAARAVVAGAVQDELPARSIADRKSQVML